MISIPLTRLSPEERKRRHRESVRRWTQRNKDWVKNYQRTYQQHRKCQETHREKCRENSRRYYETHREEILEKRALRREQKVTDG